MSFWEEIKRPFNLLMIAIALIPGFYFYYFPHNDRGIAYLSEGPSVIYDSKISSPAIHLVDNENSPIKSDTYIQTFTIWNSGSSPVEPAEVRKPISVTFQGAERILDTTIVASTDPDVSDFKISDKNSDGKQFPDTVFLTWKHFDPKKAVKFQVIYCQQTKPSTLVASDIVGVQKLQSGIKQKPWPDTIGKAIMNSVVALVFLSIMYESYKSKAPNRWIKICAASIVAITMIVVMVAEVVSKKIFSPTPPQF